MSIFNRAFLALLACAWCVALAAGLLLVWDQDRVVDISNSIMSLNFDLVFETQAEQILATIIIGAAALPALLLLAMELVPSGRGFDRGSRRRDESYGALQARVESLQKRLDDEKDLRKDTQKDVERERRVLREQAERDARLAREPVQSTTVVEEQPRRRHNWRFLPGRHA